MPAAESRATRRATHKPKNTPWIRFIRPSYTKAPAAPAKWTDKDKRNGRRAIYK